MKNKNNSNKEVRSFNLGIEIREKDGKKYLFGYAVKYNELSRKLGGWFREKFDAGAFDDIIASDEFRNNLDLDTICSYSHAYGTLPLGRRSAGTLEIGSDETGLWYECELPDTTHARDLEVSISRGDIRHSSFEFKVGKDGRDTWQNDPVHGEVRTVHKVTYLKKVNPVEDPAYENSTVDVAKRSFDTWQEENQKPNTEEIQRNINRRHRENEARERTMQIM